MKPVGAIAIFSYRPVSPTFSEVFIMRWAKMFVNKEKR